MREARTSEQLPEVQHYRAVVRSGRGRTGRASARRAAASREREAQRATEFQRRSADRAAAGGRRERAAVSARLDEVRAMVTACAGRRARHAGTRRRRHWPPTSAGPAANADKHGRRDLTAVCARRRACAAARSGWVAVHRRPQARPGRRQVIDRAAGAPGRARHGRGEAGTAQVRAVCRTPRPAGRSGDAARRALRSAARDGRAVMIAAYAEQSTEVALAARAKLEEATDRLEVVRTAAESAAADARAFCDDELAETLRDHAGRCCRGAGHRPGRPGPGWYRARWGCPARRVAARPPRRGSMNSPWHTSGARRSPRR